MTAPILNDRDLSLQAAKYRSKQTNLAITGTASAFLASLNSKTILPLNIVLTATPSGSVFSGSATYTWSYALSSAPNTWITLGTGKTWTLNNSDLWVKNAFIQYRCIISENLLDSAYGYYTVTYSSEGAESNFITLSRTNVLVTCDSNGNPLNYNNTDIVVTVSRGSSDLVYSTNTTTPNSFTVSVASVDLTPITPSTSTSTSFTMPGISAIAQDGAKIVLTITVYDASATPVATTYTKTVVYNKVSNGVIGADGANLTPVANYDFAGATLPTLPTVVTFAGTIATYESGTATLFTNTVLDQNLRLTNLSIVPANSYIISMRVKWISGAWEGSLFYSNPGHGESGLYYKAIPQPAIGVWTTINVDMRALTAGGTDYLTGGNITNLRFDFVNALGASVAVDYISVGKYGVAEATKSITLSMYQWATSAPLYSGTFTYTWGTGNISAFPSGWSAAAGVAPGNGYTLYQRNIVLTDTGLALTTNANWDSSTVNTIGYRNDGTIGINGDSYRIAYVITNGVWTGVSPQTSLVAPTAAVATAVAGSGDLAPTSTVTVGGTTTSWSKTATSTLTDGQYMYQSDGLYSANTGNIVWGVPYLSNLKVGSLSALAASLGVVEVATSGSLYSGKTTFGSTSAGFFLGNDGGNAKFKIGTAVVGGVSNELGFDSSTGVLTLKGGSVLNAAGTSLISSTTVPSDINNSAIVIGGANLMRNSGNFSSATGWTSNGSTVTYSSTVPYGSYGTLQLVGAGGAANNVVMRLKANTQYTISAFVKGSAAIATAYDNTLHIQSWRDEDTGNVHQETAGAYDTAITTSWKRIYSTFTTPSSATLTYCRFYFYPLAAGFTLNVGYVKLEEGNIPTDWVINVEDAAALVEAARASAVTSATTTAASDANTKVSAQNTAMIARSNAVMESGPSLALDVQYWPSANVQTITDGKEGNTVARSINSTYYNDGIYHAIDTSRKYKVRFWARAAAGTNGLLYFTLRQFKDNAGTTCDVNGGRSPYAPSGVAAHTNWVLYESYWNSTTPWQTGVKYVQPEWLGSYNGTTGYWEIQGFKWWDITEVQAAADVAAAAASAATAATSAAYSATSSISGKLDKSGAQVMTGPVSFNTAGAIVVGEINANTGVPDTGLYLGSGGLVGRKSGSNTFVIDTNGDATFKGTVEASTLKSTDNLFVIDLINKTISISV